MIDLSKRSAASELLDEDNIAFADIRQNMKELNIINKYLGGHNITLAGLKDLLTGNEQKEVSICEIGSGGGDNLKAISDYCKKRDIKASFTGIDIKPECSSFAKEQYPHLEATWVTGDYKNVNFDAAKPDIIFSSLFCHHFSHSELVTMLQWMRSNAKKGFFINDLHRHWLAYYSIKWITAIFSNSFLVKNDAPLSVARSFKKQDWLGLFKDAGLDGYSIKWKWAFRYLIICKNE